MFVFWGLWGRVLREFRGNWGEKAIERQYKTFMFISFRRENANSQYCSLMFDEETLHLITFLQFSLEIMDSTLKSPPIIMYLILERLIRPLRGYFLGVGKRKHGGEYIGRGSLLGVWEGVVDHIKAKVSGNAS